MTDSSPGANFTVPKQLTRLNSSGEVYHRHEAAERQLQAILPLGRTEILERLNVESRADERFLQAETLVYLMREAKLANDWELYEAVTTKLYRYLEKSIARRVRRRVDDEDSAINAAANVLSELFLAIDDISTDKADYAQVRFNHLVKRSINKHVLQAQKQLRQDRLADSIDNHSGDETAATPELNYKDREFIEKALSVLDPEIRTAFRMKHYFGYKIESDDLQELTISKYFGKTEKTIRNWLRQADEQLRNWREKEPNQ